MKYTEEVHARNLLAMLKGGNPCHHCPAMRIGVDNYIDRPKYICKVCYAFISPSGYTLTTGCPCYRYGKEKAIKLTWLALEEKGYLE